MLEALCDPIFNPLLNAALMAQGPALEPNVRAGASSSPRARGKSPALGSGHQINCTHYYRSVDDGGVEVLPST